MARREGGESKNDSFNLKLACAKRGSVSLRYEFVCYVGALDSQEMGITLDVCGTGRTHRRADSVAPLDEQRFAAFEAISSPPISCIR